MSKKKVWKLFITHKISNSLKHLSINNLLNNKQNCKTGEIISAMYSYCTFSKITLLFFHWKSELFQVLSVSLCIKFFFQVLKNNFHIESQNFTNENSKFPPSSLKTETLRNILATLRLQKKPQSILILCKKWEYTSKNSCFKATVKFNWPNGTSTSWYKSNLYFYQSVKVDFFSLRVSLKKLWNFPSFFWILFSSYSDHPSRWLQKLFHRLIGFLIFRWRELILLKLINHYMVLSPL